MRVFRRICIAAFLATAGISLAACGSSGGGQRSPVTPPATTPPPPPPAPVNFNTQEYRTQHGLAQINVIPAYEAGAQGRNVIVSIIDSGIDRSNVEFSGRIHSQSADLVITGIVPPGDVRAGGPNLQDKDDHGTPVASIIGAARNSLGVHGVAPEATLLIFRTDDDSADEDLLYGEAISEALDRSVSIGADVVNMSFSSDDATARADFANILSYLKTNDIVAVLAAGNDGDPDPELSALGALDVAGDSAAIIAGAVNANNSIAGFSNRAGAAADIYLVAPGVGVRTTFSGAALGQTRSFSGTSAATPHISGAAALLRSLWPQLSAPEIVDILLTSATDLGDPGPDPVFGRGLLNVGAAVQPLGSVTTTSVTGESVDPGLLGAALSSSYAAALSNIGDIIILDSYGRDFKMPLGAIIQQSGPGRFDLERRFNPLDDHAYSSVRLGGEWSVQMRLTSRDQSTASLLDNQITYARDRIGNPDFAERSLSFAFTGSLGEDISIVAARGFAPGGIDRMTLPSHQTLFLSESAFTDPYLPHGQNSATAFARYRLNNAVTADLLITHGRDYDSAFTSEFIAQNGAGDATRVSVMRGGLNFSSGELLIRYEQGFRNETGSVFNAHFSGAGGATIYSAVEGAWSPAPLWRLQGRLAAGMTFGRGDFGFGAFAAGNPTLKTTQFSLAVSRQRLFGDADRVWLGVSQPLQIESGALQLLLPTGFDQQTETLIFSPVTASLAAAGRRLDFEAGYRLFLGPLGSVDLNVLHQTYGDFDVPAETTALVRGGFDF